MPHQEVSENIHIFRLKKKIKKILSGAMAADCIAPDKTHFFFSAKKYSVFFISEKTYVEGIPWKYLLTTCFCQEIRKILWGYLVAYMLQDPWVNIKNVFFFLPHFAGETYHLFISFFLFFYLFIFFFKKNKTKQNKQKKTNKKNQKQLKYKKKKKKNNKKNRSFWNTYATIHSYR